MADFQFPPFQDDPYFPSIDDAFLAELMVNSRLIKKFCEIYHLELLNITRTAENGRLEPAYTFSDERGYYTIEGIVKSLGDERYSVMDSEVAREWQENIVSAMLEGKLYCCINKN